MNRLATLYDNAMLYKDLTQWIRTRTFSVLFTALLGFGLVVAWSFAYLTFGDDTAPGPIAFSLLNGALAIYLLIIGFNGMGLTSREFINRTFELYALSGMSLERMVFGKFSSMMAQYLFGFFCLVPFMFFAYLMGGLDFYTVVGTILLMGLAAPPFFLVLLAGATLQQGRRASMVGRVVMVLFALWAAQSILGMFISTFLVTRMVAGHSGGPSAPSALISWILSGGSEVFWICLTFALFYVMGCLLFFYISCNLISSSSDSRETAVKLLLTLLCISIQALILVLMSFNPSPSGSGEAAMPGLGPVFFAALALGLFFYYTPLRIPRMAELRRERAKRLRSRLVYRIFAPGPWGTASTLIVIIVASGAFTTMAFILSTRASRMWVSDSGDHAIGQFFSLICQIPFFLVLPGALYFNSRKLRYNLGTLRLAVFAWWLAAAAVLLVLRVVLENILRFNDLSYLSDFGSLILSPFGSLFVGWDTDSYYDSAPVIRIVLGLVGIALMFNLPRSRARAEERDRAGAARASAAPEPAAALPRTVDPLGDEPMTGEADA